MMKKIVLLVVCLLLAGCICAAQGETVYRNLVSGNSGDDVMAVKLRLKELGYYTSSKFNANFTEAMIDVIKLFQKNNGLTQSGEAERGGIFPRTARPFPEAGARCRRIC